MTIRTKLRLLSMLPLALTLIFGIVSYETARRLQTAHSKAKLAQEINRGLFELSLRTSNYFQGSTQQQSWWVQHRKLSVMFQETVWTSRGEQMIIRWLHQHHKNLATLYQQALRERERVLELDDELPDEDEPGRRDEQLIRHLLDRTTMMVSQAYLLENVSLAEVRDLQQRATLVVGITLGLVAMAVLALSGLLGRSILLPLQRLQDGARIVADGDVAYQVAVDGDDEVAALARSFNEMTAHLKESYNALEQEIAERKEVQAALARHRDELEMEVARRTAEIKEANDQLQDEIGARRVAQERTEQLNMMLTAIRGVDQLITAGIDQEALLNGTCRVLCDICGHRAAWIALVDSHGDLASLTQAGEAETSPTSLADLREHWPCPCVESAVKEGAAQVMCPAESDCSDCPIRAMSGASLSMTAPVQHGQTTFGVISVTSPGYFIGDSEAQALFQELADDVALALHGLALQRQRDDAEAQRQLHVAELARSNAELQQFAYVASHDLQEPLRGISGCLQLLKQRYHGQMGELANQLIEHSVAGADRMRALIQDLLRYSRAGTRTKSHEMVDLNVVLAEVLRDLSVAIEESGAQVVSEQLPSVRGDATQLSQVLQNLIGNGIKFSGEAPPFIEIYAHEADDGWHLIVQDHGVGIDERYKERIFEVFQRLHTRTEYPGTGMGLAICKKIVERHDGRIWLDPGSEDGARFHLVLPKPHLTVSDTHA